MSSPGDVVWSRGRAWLRRNDYFGGAGKLWWMACTEAVCEAQPCGGWDALAYLREHDDFRWLVRDGKRVIDADDYPPQVAYEAYTFQIANLTDLLAQAEKDRDVYAADWHRITTERDRARAELAAALTRSGEIAADANDAYRDGGLEERAAIVAWLEDSKRGDLSGRYLAAFVERGAHLGGDDE